MSNIDFSKIFLNADESFKQPEEIAESLLLIKDINQSYNIKLEMIGWLKDKGQQTSFLPEIKAIYDHARDLSGIGVGLEIREEDFLILMERCDAEDLSQKFRKPNFRNYKKSLLKLMNYMDLDAENRIGKEVYADLEKNGLYPEVLDGIKKYINGCGFYFKGQIYDRAIDPLNGDKITTNVFSLIYYKGEISSKEESFLKAMNAAGIDLRKENIKSDLADIFEGKEKAKIDESIVEFYRSDSKFDEAEKIYHLIMQNVKCVKNQNSQYTLNDFTVVCSDQKSFSSVNNLFYARGVPAYSSYKFAQNDISTDFLRLILAGIKGDAQAVFNFYNLYIAGEPVKFPDLTNTDVETLYKKFLSEKLARTRSKEPEIQDPDIKLKNNTSKTKAEKYEWQDGIINLLKSLIIHDIELSCDEAISRLEKIIGGIVSAINGRENKEDRIKIEFEAHGYKETVKRIFGTEKRKLSEYIDYIYLISSKSNRERLNKDLNGVRVSMMNEPFRGGKCLIFSDVIEDVFLKSSNPIKILSRENYFSLYKSVFGVDPCKAVMENFRILTSGDYEKAIFFVPQWGEEIIPSTKIDSLLSAMYGKKKMQLEVDPEKQWANGLSAEFSFTLKDAFKDKIKKIVTDGTAIRPEMPKFTIRLGKGNIIDHLSSPSRTESFMSCPAKFAHDLNVVCDAVESQIPFAKGNFFHDTTEAFLKYFRDSGTDLLTKVEYESITGVLKNGKDSIANDRFKEFSQFYWSGFESESFGEAYSKLKEKIRASGIDSVIEEYIENLTANDPYLYYTYEKQKYELTGFIARLITELGPTPADVAKTFAVEVKFMNLKINDAPEIIIQRGYIDFMFTDYEKRVRLFDIKSTRKFEQYVDESENYRKVQLMLYREAVSRHLKGQPGVNFYVEREESRPQDRDCQILSTDYFSGLDKNSPVTADYISNHSPFIVQCAGQNFDEFKSVFLSRLNDFRTFSAVPNSNCEYCGLKASCTEVEDSKFEKIEHYKPKPDAAKQSVRLAELLPAKVDNKSGEPCVKKFIMFDGDKQEAVKLNNADIIISAGAGAGKTEVLSSKYVNLLLKDENSDVENIVCITFTKKAAGEMQKRIYSKLNDTIESGYFFAVHIDENPGSYRLKQKEIEKLKKSRDKFYENNLISTFHSFCNKFISEYGYFSSNLSGTDVAQSLSEDFGVGEESVKFLKELYDSGFKSVVSEEVYETFTEWLGSRHLIYSDENGQAGGCIPEILGLYKQMKLSGKPFNKAIDWVPELDEYLKRVKDTFGKISDKSADYEEYIKERNRILALIEAEIEKERLKEDIPKLNELKNKFKTGQNFTFKRLLSTKKYPECELREALLNFTESDEFKDIYAIIYEKSADPDLNNKEWAIKKAVFSIVSALDCHITEFKAAKGVLEQDDLHLQFISMLEDINVSNELKSRFRYILVDEFQDTNWLQDKILSMLKKDSEIKFFMVGDKKQSIYRFQQCDVQIYEKYLKEFEKNKFHFSENFRSSPSIIKLNNTLFSKVAEYGYDLIKEKKDISKALESRKDEYEKTVNLVNIHYEATKEKNPKKNEAGNITDNQLNRLRRMSEASLAAETVLLNCPQKNEYGKWAVLIRKYTHIAYIVEAFRTKNIPFTLILKKDLFNLNEVTEFITVLKAALRIIKPEEIEHIPGYAELIAEINKTDPLISIIFRLFNHQSYRNYLARFSDYKTKLGNVKVLIENLTGLLTETENDRERFLTALEKNIKENSAGVVVQRPDAVTIMTVHSAKGLEFDNLIVANIDERENNKGDLFNYLNLWNSEKKSNDIDFSMSGYKPASDIDKEAKNFFMNEYIKFKNKKFDEAERANLLYVALTRAKKSITVIIQTSKMQPKMEDGKSVGWAKYLIEKGKEFAEIYPWFTFTQKDINEFDLSGYINPTETHPDIEYLKETVYEIEFDTQKDKPQSVTGLAHKDDEAVHEKANTAAIDTGNFLHLFMSKKINDIFRQEFDLKTELDNFRKSEVENQDARVPAVRKMLENIIADVKFKEYVQNSKILCEKSIFDRNIQGYIDLVMLCGDEVIVLDYKTYLNKFPDDELIGKYKNQINIYAEALSKIYTDKAIKKFLFFIGKDKAEMREIGKQGE